MRKIIYWLVFGIFLVIVVFIILSLLTKEEKEIVLTSRINFWHLQISGNWKDSVKFEKIKDVIFKKAKRILKEQERINTFAENEYVPVSDEMIYLLKKSIQIANLTGGYYDPTYYPLLQLWGFETGTYKLPQYGEIELVKKIIDYREIDVEGNTIKLGKNQKITVEDILKPYLVLKAKEMLKNTKAIIELDEIFLNTKGGKFGIKDPQNPQSKLGEIETEKEEIIVSLNPFYNFFGIGEDIYHYIINPKTGYPTRNNITGIILVGKDCTLLAKAKALYCMGIKKAINFLENSKIKGLIIYKIGGKTEIYHTENLKFYPSKGD